MNKRDWDKNKIVDMKHEQYFNLAKEIYEDSCQKKKLRYDTERRQISKDYRLKPPFAGNVCIPLAGARGLSASSGKGDTMKASVSAA